MSEEESSRVQQSPVGGDGSRLTAFRVAVLISIVVLAVVSPVILLGLGWFLEEYQESGGAAAVSHRVHEISFGILFAMALVGALSQRREPERNIAGMQQLIIVTMAFTVVVSLTTRFELLSLVYVAPAVVALYFHPARASVLRPSFRPWRLGLLLTAVAVPPFLGFAIRQIELALAGAQDHTTHWGAMAAFFIAVLLLSVLVALRPPGFEVTALSVGGAAILYGLASIVYPFDASAHGSFSGLVAIAWGLVWIAITIRSWELPSLRAQRGVYGMALRVARGFAIFLASVFVVVLWTEGDDPPKVPHALVDTQGVAVSFDDANRTTCVRCHNSQEVGGASAPFHGPGRFCPDSGYPRCWGGRNDCVGCHQYDPRLGGSTESISRGATLGVPVPGNPAVLLGKKDLETIAATVGVGPP